MKSRRLKSKNFQNFQPKFFGGQPKSLADENKEFRRCLGEYLVFDS